jgi:hypothetical protein
VTHDAHSLRSLDDVRCIIGEPHAFRRSRLWQPETWLPRQPVSFGKQMAPRLGGGTELAQRIGEAIEADYRDDL